MLDKEGGRERRKRFPPFATGFQKEPPMTMRIYRENFYAARLGAA